MIKQMMKINLLFEPHYVKNKHIKKIKINKAH
jgi:hypothetical protein